MKQSILDSWLDYILVKYEVKTVVLYVCSQKSQGGVLLEIKFQVNNQIEFLIRYEQVTFPGSLKLFED